MVLLGAAQNTAWLDWKIGGDDILFPKMTSFIKYKFEISITQSFDGEVHRDNNFKISNLYFMYYISLFFHHTSVPPPLLSREEAIHTSSITAILALSPCRGIVRNTRVYPPFLSAYLSGAASNKECTRSLS